jgi:hypothetical protein
MEMAASGNMVYNFFEDSCGVHSKESENYYGWNAL